jgi:hypothetical protein
MATKPISKRRTVTSEKDEVGAPQSITTAVHLPTLTWNLLRAVAFSRAQRTGGRASVSKLITDLVEERRPLLEREVAAK